MCIQMKPNCKRKVLKDDALEPILIRYMNK